MKSSLLVSVRFHDGRYHGIGDWPPAPARLYQALMAGTAKGAQVPKAELEALEWLEELSPPVIAAPHGKLGKSYTIFVPNNDLDAKLKKNFRISAALAKIRVGKKIVRPIFFDSNTPIVYWWSFNGDESRATKLCEIADNLYQLGRGIDMAWANAEIIEADEAQIRVAAHGGTVYYPSRDSGSDCNLLCPKPGTRQSLTARFKGMRARLHTDSSKHKTVFINPPKPLLQNVAYNAPPHRFVFALRASNNGHSFSPRPLGKVANLITEVRDKVAARLSKDLPDQVNDIARYLVGQGATDADKADRIQIVPLPSIGHSHADMMIRRIVVHVPQSCPLRSDDLAWAFAQVAWSDDDGVVLTELQAMEDDEMVKQYKQNGRYWCSVTPLALTTARRRRIDPERMKDEAKDAPERLREESRAVHAVRQALRHAGTGVLPAVVLVQREPFDNHGQRAEAFASGSRFPKEVLWHVAMTFDEPVGGHLLLGDGRYLGLGLMRPSDSLGMPGVLAFAIETGLADDADPALVAHAARRAMLARMQSALPKGRRLPLYVSGHEDNGNPARSGHHRHIAVVPDLSRRRIIFIAPNLLQRRGVDWRDFSDDHARLESALKGMNILRAGRAGCLTLVPALLEAESDPLFSCSQVWESVSDYRVTRHRRRLTDKQALKQDVLAELARIGWPEPSTIDVLSVRRGPQDGLSGRFRLAFAVAQTGPLVIGSTMHKGGGLFASGTASSG